MTLEDEVKLYLLTFLKSSSNDMISVIVNKMNYKQNDALNCA